MIFVNILLRAWEPSDNLIVGSRVLQGLSLCLHVESCEHFLLLIELWENSSIEGDADGLVV